MVVVGAGLGANAHVRRPNFGRTTSRDENTRQAACTAQQRTPEKPYGEKPYGDILLFSACDRKVGCRLLDLISAGDSASVSALNDITVSTLTAGIDVAAWSGNDMTISTVTATWDVSLTAQGGRNTGTFYFFEHVF